VHRLVEVDDAIEVRDVYHTVYKERGSLYQGV
jgi:hypothetical protein